MTITTDKDRDSTSYAVFEDGVEIVGGSAGRESTTQGGNAVQILQLGAQVGIFCLQMVVHHCITFVFLFLLVYNL